MRERADAVRELILRERPPLEERLLLLSSYLSRRRRVAERRAGYAVFYDRDGRLVEALHLSDERGLDAFLQALQRPALGRAEWN